MGVFKFTFKVRFLIVRTFNNEHMENLRKIGKTLDMNDVDIKDHRNYREADSGKTLLLRKVQQRFPSVSKCISPAWFQSIVL